MKDSSSSMRAVIVDQLSGREIVAGPEELNATQPLCTYLTQKARVESKADHHPPSMARSTAAIWHS
jgi:hypothetical protein